MVGNLVLLDPIRRDVIIILSLVKTFVYFGARVQEEHVSIFFEA